METADDASVFPITVGGVMIGGSKDGEWLDAGSTAALATGERQYRVFAGGFYAGMVTGTIYEPPDGLCHSVGRRFSVQGRDWQAGQTVGVSGDWDAMPRTPKTQSLDIPEYASAIRALLNENGIAEPEVALTSVQRIDLDGDRTDEVLITAMRLSALRATGTLGRHAKAGDYAVVALRKVVDDQAVTTPLFIETYQEDVDMIEPWLPDIRGILDLNGDGDLEIVIGLQAYESGRADVIEIDGAEVHPLFTTACSF
jgi:hypothetical protein